MIEMNLWSFIAVIILAIFTGAFIAVGLTSVVWAKICDEMDKEIEDED